MMDDEQRDDDQEAKPRRTLLLFGRDVSPEEMAAAINAERKRQLQLKADRTQEDPPESNDPATEDR
jgi:hypothetical protein